MSNNKFCVTHKGTSDVAKKNLNITKNDVYIYV